MLNAGVSGCQQVHGCFCNGDGLKVAVNQHGFSGCTGAQDDVLPARVMADAEKASVKGFSCGDQLPFVVLVYSEEAGGPMGRLLRKGFCRLGCQQKSREG